MVRQYDCLKQGGPLEIGARNIPHPAKDYVVTSELCAKKVIQLIQIRNYTYVLNLVRLNPDRYSVLSETFHDWE